ncbi:MAG: hypothetical protein ACWGSD_18635 [Thermodesulfobacteriota bacterium]
MVIKALKAVKWLVLVALLLAGFAIYLAITGGGDSFRWVAQKTEETGQSLGDTLEKTADKADRIEEAADKAGERLKEIRDKIP